MIKTRKIIKTFLLILIVSFIVTYNVNAKDIAKVSWESKSQEITNLKETAVNNVAYKDGFVTSKTIYNNVGEIITNLTYYDSKGNQIYNNKYKYDYYGNSNNNDGLIFFVKLFTIDDNLYSISTDYYTYYNNKSNYALYKITKYNTKLKEVKHITIKGKNALYILRNSKLNIDSNINGYNYVSLEDNMITILCGERLIQVDKNLNNLSSIKRTSETNKLYFKELTNKNKGYLGYYTKNKVTVYTGSDNNKAYIEIYKNNKYDSKINNTSYNKFINPIIVNKMIIVVGSNNNNTSSDILMYNLNGKLIETINNSEIDTLISINENNNSFVTTNLSRKNNCSRITYKWEKTKVCYELRNKVYQVPFNITLNDNTGGLIKVKDTAYTDETIQLEINKNSGYSSNDITIKDEDGNEVVLDREHNTFKMPSSNVTITTKYKKEPNPTTNSPLYVISAVLILFIIGLYFSRKIKLINQERL